MEPQTKKKQVEGRKVMGTREGRKAVEKVWVTEGRRKRNWGL